MSFDREKTALQENGAVKVFGSSLRGLLEIATDIGLDPADVRCSAVTLTALTTEAAHRPLTPESVSDRSGVVCRPTEGET